MARIVIWGGGPYHPYKEQSRFLREKLSALGHDVAYGESRETLKAESLTKADLLVMMGLDWSAQVKAGPEAWEDPATRKTSYTPLEPEYLKAILDHARAGKPQFWLHASLVSFEDSPELTEILDGRWVEGRSNHPPLHEFPVAARHPDHPLMKGVSNFRVADELYTGLNNPMKSDILLESFYEGAWRPLAWAREDGGRRMAYLGLGHDMNVYAHPMFQKMLFNGFEWLLKE